MIIIETAAELEEIVAKAIRKVLSETQPAQLTGNTNEHYNSAEVRKLFGGLHPNSLYQWERLGLLKPTIIRRRKFYLKSDIELLLTQKKLKQRA